MLVRQLIGRQAGMIVDMAYHAAQAGLAMGTCEVPTDAELAQHGMGPARPLTVDAKPEQFPPGYSGAARPDGLGFDVHWGSLQQPLNDVPLANLLAARDFTHEHFRQSHLTEDGPQQDDDPIIPVVNARIMARLIPDATLHVYAGGHIALVTEAHELAPVIEGFLDS